MSSIGCIFLDDKLQSVLVGEHHVDLWEGCLHVLMGMPWDSSQTGLSWLTPSWMLWMASFNRCLWLKIVSMHKVSSMCVMFR